MRLLHHGAAARECPDDRRRPDRPHHPPAFVCEPGSGLRGLATLPGGAPQGADAAVAPAPALATRPGAGALVFGRGVPSFSVIPAEAGISLPFRRRNRPTG